MKPFSTPEAIVKLITTSYINNLGIFAQHTNAEDLIPKSNDEDKAKFLFWIIQMDYATKSETLYRNALLLWKKNKKYFEAKYIKDIPEDKLLKLVITYLKPRYVNEIVKRYKINSELLIEKYEGKEFNIINYSKDAKELLKRIEEFRGFGPKLANFLLRTYVSLFDMKYKDINEVYQPVDVHDVRQTFEWGFINSPKMTTKNIKDVKFLWSKACINAKVSWIVFDKALWLLGSKGERGKEVESLFYKNLGIIK